MQILCKNQEIWALHPKFHIKSQTVAIPEDTAKNITHERYTFDRDMLAAFVVSLRTTTGDSLYLSEAHKDVT